MSTAAGDHKAAGYFLAFGVYDNGALFRFLVTWKGAFLHNSLPSITILPYTLAYNVESEQKTEEKNSIIDDDETNLQNSLFWCFFAAFFYR